MRAGGGSKAKNEPRAGHAGIHGNSESGNHPKPLPLGCLEGQRGPRTEVTWDLLHIPRDYPSTFPKLKARHTIKLTQLRAKPLAAEGKAQVSLQPATLIAKTPHCTLELHGSEDDPL